MQLDDKYIEFVKRVLFTGEWRETRNAKTLSTFGTTIKFNVDDKFPLLTIRKIFYKGVFGEFKSFLQNASTVKKFEENGCPFWKQWADKDGKLKLDYPPGYQLTYVIDLIKNDPNSRRILIDLWNPKNIGKLSLEPCHYAYQFYVSKGTLHMIWTQRSLDVAIGLPSDFILAGLYLIGIANTCRLAPGTITMNFGDTHIYEDHYDDMLELINRPIKYTQPNYVSFIDDVRKFDISDIEILNYCSDKPIKFKLHG